MDTKDAFTVIGLLVAVLAIGSVAALFYQFSSTAGNTQVLLGPYSNPIALKDVPPIYVSNGANIQFGFTPYYALQLDTVGQADVNCTFENHASCDLGYPLNVIENGQSQVAFVKVESSAANFTLKVTASLRPIIGNYQPVKTLYLRFLQVSPGLYNLTTSTTG